MRLGKIVLVVGALANKVHVHKMVPVAVGDSQITCPNGYTLENDLCVSIATQPMIATCMEGVLQPDNTCLLIEMATLQCPYQYTLAGNVCVRTEMAQAIISCPPDYSLVNEPGYHHGGGAVCRRTIETMQFGCLPGTYPVGDSCQSEISIPAELQCPPGSFLDGTVCSSSEVVPCTTQYVGHGHHGHHRRLQSSDSDDVIVETTEQTIVSSDDIVVVDDDNNSNDPDHRALNRIKYPHVHNHHAIAPAEIDILTPIPPTEPQMCNRNRTFAATAFCLQGELVGNMCVSAQLVPKVPVQPLVSVENASPLATCPAGFSPCGSTHHKFGTSECCAQEQIPAQFTCRPGFTLVGDQCRASTEASLICSSPSFTPIYGRNECMSKHTVAPTVIYTTQMACEGINCGTATVHHGHSHGHGKHRY